MASWREVPPTAGLPPRWRDLIGPASDGDAFEAAVAAFLDRPAGQIECSGTACLVIAFETLKARSARRTVIVPGYTCPLVVHAADRAGLTSVACDLAPGSLDLDLAHLARLLDDDTLCVVPAHYGGALTDVAAVRRATEAVSSEIAVIEDAAQAFGATVGGRSVGRAGHLAVFSFAVGKGLTLFEGGCLVTDDAALRADLRRVARRLVRPSPGLELRRAVELAGYHAAYNPLGVRLTYGRTLRHWLDRDDPIRAVGDAFSGAIPMHPVGRWRRSVGTRALTRLPDHLQQTSQRFQAIVAALRRDDRLAVHQPRGGEQPTGTFCLVTLPSGQAADAALHRLWRSGIGVSKLFARALADYPELARPTLSATDRARDLAQRTITISTSCALSPPDLGAIGEVLAECADGPALRRSASRSPHGA